MILAHHGGEAGLLVGLASAAGAVPVLLALGRYRLGEFVDRLRRRV